MVDCFLDLLIIVGSQSGEEALEFLDIPDESFLEKCFRNDRLGNNGVTSVLDFLEDFDKRFVCQKTFLQLN